MVFSFLSPGATFLAGFVCGSIFDAKTVLILLPLSVIVFNHPLPEVLGGGMPQELVEEWVKNMIQHIQA